MTIKMIIEKELTTYSIKQIPPSSVAMGMEEIQEETNILSDDTDVQDLLY